jgi:ABC-type branched-subunit amino acid transport system ATPase component
VRVSYGGVQAVRGATPKVGDGQIVGLVGANGAGKTSVLNAITALVRPHGQECRLMAGISQVRARRTLCGAA